MRAVFPEVREVVEGLRREVVVRTEHEPGPEPPADGPKRCDRRFDGLGIGEEVPGDNGHVGGGETLEEPSLLDVVPHEVKVRQMEDRQWPGNLYR